MKRMINSKNGFKLYYPFNKWDMNYHLIEEKTGNHYLIHIGDISEDLEFDDYYSWEKLKALDDIDDIKELAWKII